MNPGFEGLHPYPFEKLKALKAGTTPPEALSHIALSIGEPKHATPSIISEAVLTHLHHLSSYPATLGSVELRQAIIAYTAFVDSVFWPDGLYQIVFAANFTWV